MSITGCCWKSWSLWRLAQFWLNGYMAICLTAHRLFVSIILGHAKLPWLLECQGSHLGPLLFNVFVNSSQALILFCCLQMIWNYTQGSPVFKAAATCRSPSVNWPLGVLISQSICFSRFSEPICFTYSIEGVNLEDTSGSSGFWSYFGL